MKKIIKRFFRNKDPMINKFHFFFLWFVRITLLIAIAQAGLSEKWHIFGVALLGLTLTFLALLVEKNYNINIPIEFEIGIVFLIYGSIFLGELSGYYATYWWWDLLLHSLTGVIVGFVGFLTLLVMYRRKNVVAAPISLAFFSFSLAAAIGGVWEIFEFGMDQIFGLNMQKSGLIDTMGDLIVNDLGALFASLVGYLYLKGENPLFLKTIIGRFRKENPHLSKDLKKFE